MRLFTTITLSVIVALCASVGAYASSNATSTQKHHLHPMAYVAIAPKATALVPVAPPDEGSKGDNEYKGDKGFSWEPNKW